MHLVSLTSPHKYITYTQLLNIYGSEERADEAFLCIDAAACSSELLFTEVSECYIKIALTGCNLLAEQLQNLLDTARARLMSLSYYVERYVLPWLQGQAEARMRIELLALIG